MSDEDGYSGPAVLSVDGREIPVRVTLDARHEPLDGRLHWFGRLTPTEAGASVTGIDTELRTDGGRAVARLGEPDPWGRYRVTGVGRPPYRIEDPDLDAE